MADADQDDTAKQRALLCKFLAEMSPERLARANERFQQVATEEHGRFREAFKAGECYFCGDALTSFNQSNPCRHSARPSA
jgi:hypothetical protein